MFRPHKGTCKCHEKERWIVNKRGQCGQGVFEKKNGKRDIGRKTLDPFQNKFLNKKKPIKKKIKVTKEAALFREIFEERDPWCEWCGKGILEFSVANYHHIKPKSKFPELRLVKSNIVKICFDCHFNEHNNSKTS